MNPMPQKFIVFVFERAVEERRPVRKEEGIDGDEGEKWERGRGGGGGTEKDGGEEATEGYMQWWASYFYKVTELLYLRYG
jgi:hypothetical protein